MLSKLKKPIYFLILTTALLATTSAFADPRSSSSVCPSCNLQSSNFATSPMGTLNLSMDWTMLQFILTSLRGNGYPISRPTQENIEIPHSFTLNRMPGWYRQFLSSSYEDMDPIFRGPARIPYADVNYGCGFPRSF